MMTADVDARFGILGVWISAVNLDSASHEILQAVETGRIAHVCVTGVHGVMECRRDSALQEIHNRSLLTVPDGMPLVWIARYRGLAQVDRVYGPDLVRALLRRTASRAIGHFWMGSSEHRLEQLVQRIQLDWPDVRVAGWWAPPFRPLTNTEWEEIAHRILNSDAHLVWVGLSTPKQERYAAALAQRLREHRPSAQPGRGIIVIGVGAAFDILAGVYAEAPRWIQRSGFQWLYRLLREPRRLAPRYLRIVPAFLVAMLLEGRRRDRR